MHIDWTTLAQVVVAAFIIGVGAVVLFALGVRGWSDHADARLDGRSDVRGATIAVVSFALCGVLVGAGLWVIVAG